MTCFPADCSVDGCFRSSEIAYDSAASSPVNLLVNLLVNLHMNLPLGLPGNLPLGLLENLHYQWIRQYTQDNTQDNTLGNKLDNIPDNTSVPFTTVIAARIALFSIVFTNCNFYLFPLPTHHSISLCNRFVIRRSNDLAPCPSTKNCQPNPWTWISIHLTMNL